MKNLRNISIYYILIGIICALSYVFFALGVLALLGIILLVLFLILRYFKVKKEHFIANKSLRLFTLFGAYLLPVIVYAFINLYQNVRLYQVIVPQNFEGTATLSYKENENPNFIAFFQALKLFPKGKVEVNKNGKINTVLIYNSNYIPFLGGGATIQNADEGIFFLKEDDSEIKVFTNTFNLTEADTARNSPITEKQAYYAGGGRGYKANEKSIMKFVVTQPKNYYKYFKTEREKAEERKQDSIKGIGYDNDEYNVLKK